jgi:hypothetical protein
VFSSTDKRHNWLKRYFYSDNYQLTIVICINKGELSPDFTEEAFLALVRRDSSLRVKVTPICVHEATSRVPAQKSGPQFAGLKCSDVHVTMRVDELNVKRLDTRTLGESYPLSSLKLVAGDSKYNALMGVSQSTLSKNMIGYPVALDESTLSRFCRTFCEVTGVLDRPLSRRGKTLLSNCGKMTWSSENKSLAPEESSNQNERIDRTKDPRKAPVGDRDRSDPWSLESLEDEEN